MLLIANIAMVVGLVPVGVALAITAMMLPGHFLSHTPISEVVSGSLRSVGLTAPWGALAAVGWILKKFATRLPAADAPPEPTPWDAVIRSLFVCGAGQLHNGQTMKGILLLPFTAAFYGLCLFLLVALGDHEGHPRFGSFILPFKVVGVVWALSLADAYWNAAKRIRASRGPLRGADETVD